MRGFYEFCEQLVKIADEAVIIPYSVRNQIHEALNFFKEVCSVTAEHGGYEQSEELTIKDESGSEKKRCAFNVDTKEDADKVKELIIELLKIDGFVDPSVTYKTARIGFSFHVSVKW